MEGLIQRIGSLKISLDFEIEVHSIDLQVAEISYFTLAWERREKKSETCEFTVTPSETKVRIGCILRMENTMYQKGLDFMPKPAKFKLKQKLKQEWLCVGTITLDLSQYVHKPLIENIFFMDVHDSKARICLSVSGQSNAVGNNEFNIEKSIAEVNNKYSILYQQYLDTMRESKQIKEDLAIWKRDIEVLKENDAHNKKQLEM